MLSLIVIVSTQIMAQENYNVGMCPVTPKLGDSPSKTYWLYGSIGGRSVRMYLERGGDVILGAFYYTGSDWTPTVLGGYLTVYGTLDASNKTETGVEIGRLTGNLSEGGFVGRWIASGQGKPLPASLKVGPQPSCKGNGPWERFDDHRWPITFSYPASWRLSLDNGSLKLTCPDPSFMAYESYDIKIRQGKQQDLADDLGFHRFGDRWIYGED
jgi:hypothetical protein